MFVGKMAVRLVHLKVEMSDAKTVVMMVHSMVGKMVDMLVQSKVEMMVELSDEKTAAMMDS
jgi:hypothetical protein